MKTLLCVDDQEAGLEIRKLLLEARGYRVLTAATAAEAFEAVRREAIDLVILDYNLAETTGEEIAREIKRTQPELPILLLSGYPSVPVSARGVVDAFLVKGESAQDFLQTIASLVGHTAPAETKKPVTREESQKLVERARDLLEKSQRLTERYQQRRK
jgi:CheY-like chemotaxis protein